MVETRSPDRSPVRGRRRGMGEVLLGGERRLGLWILPLFLLTGLLGATLAGGLVVLYYAQQVAELRETTDTARAQLDETIAEVDETAAAATAEIEEHARRFREALAQEPPIELPADVGAYALAARHEDGAVRVGSAFTVYSDERETYFATAYGLVAGEEGTQPTVELFLPDQSVTGRVHNFDPELDLAVVVVNGGPLPVAEWRPPGEAVHVGDAVYLAGLAGPGTAALVEGRTAGVSPQALLPTVPLNTYLTGAPLLDVDARVVAIAVLGYEPFGPTDGPLRYAVPVRRLCEELLRCTREDLGVDELGDEGGINVPERDATPSPRPTPSPAPGSSPQPPPDPTGSPTPQP